MIIRHIPVKAGKKSSFSRLATYITSKLEKHERLGVTRISNCQSQTIEWAIEEIQATQALNRRAVSDKTYHMLISFPAGETPSDEVLKEIESTVCNAIGFGSHQRISAVHHDTDNMHIHLAINKIHPITYAMHEPFLAYKTLGKTAEKLEVKFGLQRTNHTPSKTISENHANDLEHHTGIESFLSWIRANCLSQLQSSITWSGFHQVLTAHGLSIKARGNGFIITNNQDMFVKVSTVARNLSKSKLEERLGTFIPLNKKSFSNQSTKEKPGVAALGKKPPPRSQGRLAHLNHIETLSIGSNEKFTKKPIITRVNTDSLFKQYTLEMANIKAFRLNKLKEIKQNKTNAILKIKMNAKRKRLAVKLLPDKTSNKKILYSLISRTYKEECAKINADYLEARLKIDKSPQWNTWVDWLRLQAANKNTEAAHILRARHVKRPLTGNTVSGVNPDINFKVAKAPFDSITKSGTVIYRSGNTAIRDDGQTLKVSNAFTTLCLTTALEEAIKRYGNTIVVNGSDAFKNEIIKIALQSYPAIQFSDPSLEAKRQQELQKTIQLQEQKNVVHRRELKPRRTIGSSLAGNGRNSNRRGDSGSNSPNLNKPNLERIGRKPPPASQNRLRTMSELSMVQLSERSEMLLQSNVSGNLEHERTKPDNRLRWDVSGSGINGIAAAEKYIAEREAKRLKGIDIFQHRLFNKDDVGAFEFAGIRTIDSQNLVLLKSAKEIIVYPVDEKTVARIKKLSIGDDITMTNKGISFNRGRRL